jgi:hypothetical protein
MPTIDPKGVYYLVYFSCSSNHHHSLIKFYISLAPPILARSKPVTHSPSSVQLGQLSSRLAIGVGSLNHERACSTSVTDHLDIRYGRS